MRRSVLLASLVASSVAAAEPPGETAPAPAPRPPPAPLAPFKSHLEAAVRVGYGWMNTVGDPNPSGNGPCFDGEVAWRFRYISFGVFGELFTMRDNWYTNNQAQGITADARYDFFDLGARVTVHVGARTGTFFGVGLAWEWVLESGRESICYCANDYCTPCNPGPINQPYSQWSNAPLVELHIGATLPKTGPVSMELMAIFGAGFNPDTGDNLTMGRLAIGARF